MAESPNGNGSSSTIAGATASVGRALVTSLPAQFLCLVVINLMFVLGLLWYLHTVDENRAITEQHLADAREKLLGPILQRCIEAANIVHDR